MGWGSGNEQWKARWGGGLGTRVSKSGVRDFVLNFLSTVFTSLCGLYSWDQSSKFQ